MKLAIITTHPIQYYAPVFRMLHERGNISIMVYYTWGEAARTKYDPGFGSVIDWDIPLLEGYPYTWVKNTSADPGTHHFRGIINPGLTGQLQQWQPDALLIFGWGWHGHLRCLRFFKGRLPVFFRGDSTLLDSRGGFKELVRTQFLRWVYRHIDHAFYTGTNNKAYYKKFGLRDDQLSFAPHAVDNDRFSADHAAEAAAFRGRLQIDPEDVLVLFAGKFEKKKSPVELLEAFLTLRRLNVHLLFVGNGAQEAILKSRASHSEKVHFIDFQNQSRMPVILQACDLFCLPSAGPGETWGLAVNEAMACGKAVLVSDKVGCAIDLVKNVENGAIFESGRMGDLADSLDQLTGSKDRLQHLGMNSRAMIRPWSFAAIVRRIEDQVSGLPG
ncbi:glycosyltransferase family 4 protein [Mucilaginibacter ginsenosidivorans]|uniref:Glycosyltransferase family 4 protein n=1 Tax=Mucilaginibacter ginsenosidivorans TaxID=398053 RepID=A0A5B8UU50_9SPHI|nr:glycosyltransferase family 4 protein [Mucilaginibacter ginsenosidivorans]QEC62574.1 glycosyltransferase family 4 protein [Mucilaginibacter ginsenosidivorans]